jgi:esterase/lipase superfamily enzyme
VVAAGGHPAREIRFRFAQEETMAQQYDYVISVRRVDPRGRFEAEPGDETLFLKVPAGQKEYAPADKISFERWRSEVNDIAARDVETAVGSRGDLLIFVHGYNNKRSEILTRTRLLRETLLAEKWDGAVVAFDWPCDQNTLNYLEDRSDARDTALRLVKDCVLKLGAIQDPEDRQLWEKAGLRPSARRHALDKKCEVNIHLIGHSTGAYVIMEAFAQAQAQGTLHRSGWRIGQVAFIGGDVSSDSMKADSDWSKPMFQRIMRLTNYSNGFDDVLAVSNAKRLGAAPRAGRVGLPSSADRKAVNVDCSDYFKTIDPGAAKFVGRFTHSWHIGDPVFARDLAMTLEGRYDRNVLPTREIVNGKLQLRDEGRPPHEDKWSVFGSGSWE